MNNYKTALTEMYKKKNEKRRLERQSKSELKKKIKQTAVTGDDNTRFEYSVEFEEVIDPDIPDYNLNNYNSEYLTQNNNSSGDIIEIEMETHETQHTTTTTVSCSNKRQDTKDTILRNELKHIVIMHNVSMALCSELLGALKKYGINLPSTRIELLKNDPPPIEESDDEEEEESDNNNVTPFNDPLEAEEQKFNQIEIPTTTNKNHLDSDLLTTIMNRFTELEEKVLNGQNELKQLFNIKSTLVHDDLVVLPISERGVLEELEVKLNDKLNVTKFITMATPFKPLCNKSRHNTYGICRIITDELIMEFNWDGLQNKDALKDFNNVNRYLCEAWKGDIIENLADYEKFIRVQLSAAKARVHQATYQKNKYLKQETEAVDSIMD